ncbi:MAG: hypothetical protein GXY85_12565 [Candidatus Brocadiaceae bacterium]|nr:hypothetical protein [Candidatus Brocadiaceae bacterium]
MNAGTRSVIGMLWIGAALLAGPGNAQEMMMDNRVSNGDFAQVEDGRPLYWQAAGDPGGVDQELTVVHDDGNTHGRLECTRCEGSGGSHHAMVAQVGRVHVERGRLYEFSCRMRAEGMKDRSVTVALTDTADWQPAGLSVGVPLTTQWQEVRVPFRATASVGETSRLQFWFHEAGTLYLDDVRIVEFTVDEVAFTQTVPPAAGRNMVPNGSFELGLVGWGAVGRPIAWGNLDRLQGRIESDGAAHGRRFLRVPLGGPDGPMLYWDYYEPVARRIRMMQAANVGWIPVEPGEAYTLSCRMRASADGAQAALGVRAEEPEGASRVRARDLRETVRLSTDWRRYSFTFRPETRYVYVFVGPDLVDDSPVAVDIDAVQLERGEVATAFEPYAPLEAGIEPNSPAGIFTAATPASIRLRACNHTEEAGAVAVRLRAADFFDEAIELPDVRLDVPPSSGAERDVELPADWRGYYRLTAEFSAAGRSWSQDLRLAFVPEPRWDDTALGLNHAFPDAYLIRLARKAGCTWHRDWTLKWHDLEPRQGEYRWEIGDVQVDRVIREGVNVTALLPPYPSTVWNTSVPPDAEVSGRAPGGLAWAPKDPERLAEFVGRAVEHYGGRIRVWEFLNEPIYTHYSLPASGGYTPADYVDLLAKAAAAMRRADPECRVIGGIGSSPRHLTREVIEAGCLEHVDIFGLHLYPGRVPPESFIGQTDELLERMDRHGGRKPMWVTEFSYYGDDDPPAQPVLPGTGWAGQRLLADERQCAEYTIRLFAVMMARGVEKIIVHAGVGGRVNQPNYNCMFFKYGGAPARVFPALAVFTDLMGPNARFAASGDVGEDRFSLGFETGVQAVCVLWDAAGTARVSIPDGAECLDLMGRSVSGPTVTVSPTPLYLVGPAGAAGRIAQSVRLEP